MAKPPKRNRVFVNDRKHYYEDAKVYLMAVARRNRRDCDHFPTDVIDIENFLSKPVGKTSNCLSVNEIVDYIEYYSYFSLVDADRVREIRQHLGECEECPKNIELWESLHK